MRRPTSTPHPWPAPPRALLPCALQVLGLLEALLLKLRDEAASPEAQQRLFELAGPEEWARSA